MSYERLELYMHAFASLVSIENKGCRFSQYHGKSVCTFEEETGWNITKFLDIYEGLLIEVRKKLKKEMLIPFNLSKFVNRQIERLETIKHYDQMYYRNESADIHITDIMERLRNPGSSILNPWGTRDHQVYIDFWHDPRLHRSRPYRITIFDVGGGRYDRAIRDQYKPIEKFFNASELQAFIRTLVRTYNRPSTEKLFADVYSESPALCRDCMPEFQQTTGNCVVKNLLAAIKQDAMDFYGPEKGEVVFRDFYLYLIMATIIKANRHAIPMFFELPSIEKIAKYITRSQTIFTGIEEHDLFSGVLGSSIRREYNNLRSNILVKFTAPSSSGTLFSSTDSSSSSLDSTSVCLSTISLDDTPTARPRPQSGGGGCCA